VPGSTHRNFNGGGQMDDAQREVMMGPSQRWWPRILSYNDTSFTLKASNEARLSGEGAYQK
jgi:hypothetical protein